MQPITPNSLPIPQVTYHTAIKDLLMCLKSALRDDLHSVYIYGSVAQGRAIAGVSDLNVVVVTQSSLSASQKKVFNTIDWRFQKNFPFVDAVSIRSTVINDVVSLDALFTWGFLLKQCCVCVHGDDLAECFGDYVASWEIAKQWNMDIGQSVPILRHRIAVANTDKALLKAQREMAKKLLRAAYGLIMPKTKRWYDEPHQCAQQFLVHYPEKRIVIERLEILLGPRVIPKRSVVALLDDFGQWLVSEYKKTEFRIG
ncbi:nucleotidyltransferase domain-containing protein [Vibrio sp. ZSDZ65]|uniref:Nucleotidyltransferase domain-containing protein n=1 Tax=Vibrio qingdaonensis TaxID=2829491 RepID=A0A9X3CKR7_9VIBR|nr:nucleotidyltransferase domain-containing protein [Vibrio qingdaonensis]MCW8345039.1 nucleotidyltransferase domain-containing protein [Vibrio qingdaonensis]